MYRTCLYLLPGWISPLVSRHAIKKRLVPDCCHYHQPSAWHQAVRPPYILCPFNQVAKEELEKPIFPRASISALSCGQSHSVPEPCNGICLRVPPSKFKDWPQTGFMRLDFFVLPAAQMGLQGRPIEEQLAWQHERCALLHRSPLPENLISGL